MIEFYLPSLAEGLLQMPETEAGHAVRVLRMKPGDPLSAVDGIGNRYECRIESIAGKRVNLQIISVSKEEKHWKGRITLAVAPTKNMDRMEWLAEKCVELGIDSFVLLECRRSERKTVKTERLEKIMISAMKQSLKARLPELSGMMPLEKFLAQNLEGQKFVGYCDEQTPRVDFSKVYHPDSDVTLLIGPEGDFSPEEIQAVMKAGYQAVTFGNTRLRTETAALYSVAACHALKNRDN